MDEKEIKKALDDLHKSIEDKIKEFNQKKTEIPTEEWDKVKADFVKAAKDAMEPEIKKAQKLQEQLDALETKLKRVELKDAEKPKSFKDEVKDIFTKLKEDGKGDLRRVVRKDRGIGEIELKVDDMTASNTLTGAVVAPDHQTKIWYDPDRSARIRDLLSVGTTNSSSVTYVYESAISDGTAMTSEGSEYGQSDFDLAVGTATVRKITAYVLLSEELLEDVEGLSSYLSARLPSKLKVTEDDQLLNGAGTGQNLSGVITNSTAYSDNLADSDISEIDVLVDACRQVRDDEYQATAILVHPAKATKIKLTKDDNGNYIHPWIFMGKQGIVLDGVPVIETTAIAEDTFVVGDFKLGAQVFDRRQMSLEMSYENEDNFVKGMVTVRISERLTLAVYRAKAFVTGSFTNALATGSA